MAESGLSTTVCLRRERLLLLLLLLLLVLPILGMKAGVDMDGMGASPSIFSKSSSSGGGVSFSQS